MNPIHPAYMDAAWFKLLQVRYALATKKGDVAKQLDISPTALSMVMNGTGKYGNGKASTDHIAERVTHAYGRYPCPYLSNQAGEERTVTAAQCRQYASDHAPTHSPLAIQHWRACQQCHHATVVSILPSATAKKGA